MDKYINFWEKIPLNGRKLVDDSINRLAECFWYKNVNEQYGFLIEIPDNVLNKEYKYQFTGIEVLSKFDKNKDITVILVMLNSQKDWEIFSALSHDLLNAASVFNDAKSFYLSIHKRLERWQSILSQRAKREMALPLQMGLFTELHFLINTLVPKYGLMQSLNFWVGPDTDVQDFLLGDKIIEIKSYRTSKSAKINISSPNQLHSVKEPLFLKVYALSVGDEGESLDQLIDVFESSEDFNEEAFKIFNEKIESYGYLPPTKSNSLRKFIVDSETFYAVDNTFPKIQLDHIPDGIEHLKFSVDLNKCKDNFINDLDI